MSLAAERLELIDSLEEQREQLRQAEQTANEQLAQLSDENRDKDQELASLRERLEARDQQVGELKRQLADSQQSSPQADSNARNEHGQPSKASSRYVC